jgi:hypothetical protein
MIFKMADSSRLVHLKNYKLQTTNYKLLIQFIQLHAQVFENAAVSTE